MKQINNKSKSIRLKLFATLSITVICIIMILMVSNNVILETFYLYNKTRSLKDVYSIVNNYYSKNLNNINMEIELERISINNNFDILIKNQYGTNVYISNRNFLLTLGTMNQIFANSQQIKEQNIIYHNEEITIRKLSDNINGLMFVLLTATLDNDYELYIRMPISSIQESVKISNRLLYFIGGITIIIAGFAISIISKRVTEPIEELNTIAKDMSNLKFNKKYQVKNTDDEIDNLGISINSLSDKLEKTINTLKQTNIELEKDIEEKSKIDEMRKQFISDVSHELKTPIALIQGYAEGLAEGIDTDEESRKFYTEVILDETAKMDKLVKELLELMTLEYGKREFTNQKFDLMELINEIIKRSTVIIKEKNIDIQIDGDETVIVNADEFYVEQVISNYLTNAIKHVQEIEGEKIIKISIQEIGNKVKVTVFNTGLNIPEENINKVWNRFYKEDTSRNREAGGSGVGLSLVKAIMNNYQNKYGVENKQNGVEFYFELNR